METFVSEMIVNALNVDLLQDGATISLMKQPTEHVPGKILFSAVSIQVPLASPGNQPENKLKRSAIDAAKRALHEALEALEKHQI